MRMLRQPAAVIRFELEPAQTSVQHPMRGQLRTLDVSASHVVTAKDLRQRAQIVESALDIASRIVRKVIERDDPVVVASVAQVLGPSCATSPRVVRVNPDDVHHLRREVPELFVEGLELGITVVVDPQIARGGALMECAGGVIDARIEIQLACIAASLGIVTRTA